MVYKIIILFALSFALSQHYGWLTKYVSQRINTLGITESGRLVLWSASGASALYLAWFYLFIDCFYAALHHVPGKADIVILSSLSLVLSLMAKGVIFDKTLPKYARLSPRTKRAVKQIDDVSTEIIRWGIPLLLVIYIQ